MAMQIVRAQSGKSRAAMISHLTKVATEGRKFGDWLSSTTFAYGIFNGLAMLPAKEAEKPQKAMRAMMVINKKDYAKGMTPVCHFSHAPLIGKSDLQQRSRGWRRTFNA